MLERFIRWLTRLSAPRVIGALLGNGYDLEQRLAERERYLQKIERLLEEERNERRKLQDRLLQRHGLAPIYEAPTGSNAGVDDGPLTADELVERDKEAEVEELAMRAASDAFYMRYVEEAASVDERWRPVLKRALEMSPSR